MNNWEIAHMFDEIADLLDILGENPYKARAYRRAAHKLGNAYLDVEELAGGAPAGNTGDWVSSGKKLRNT